MIAVNISRKGRQRLIILALALIFSLPFSASWIIYNFTDIGKGEVEGSYGQLIVPPVPMSNIRLQEPAAGGAGRDLHGKWNLLYITQAGCEPDCRDKLQQMSALRIALVKDTARLQLLLGTTESGSAGELHEFLAHYSEKRILLFPYINHAVKEDTGTGPAATPRFESGKLYLIDPLGNLMMSYPANSDPDGILRDLKRLLRYSRIG
jgi:hypothetical protein